MKRKLSACVIQTFNGYKLIRNSLNSKERKDFVPIDIVYEPTLNENKSIECFLHQKFTWDILLLLKELKKEKKNRTMCSKTVSLL